MEVNKSILRKIVYGAFLLLFVSCNVLICLSSKNEGELLYLKLGILGLIGLSTIVIVMVFIKCLNYLLDKLFARENLIFETIYIAVGLIQLCNVVLIKHIDLFLLKTNLILIILTLIAHNLNKIINHINENKYD